MSMVFEEAENDEVFARPEDTAIEQDREVTLNSATVLGIFFASVLICGLCFGGGYALGRRSAPEAAPVVKNASAKVDSEPEEYRAKPSASSQNQIAAPRSSVENQAAKPPGASDVEAYEAAPANAGSKAGLSPKVEEESEPEPVPAPRATKTPNAPAVGKVAAVPRVEPAVAAVPGTFMVQIAAVSNPADGEVLVGALRKRGYTVVIRHETADALLHVQIGPFASRGEAVAMRQKLLGDGYNAILK